VLFWRLAGGILQTQVLVGTLTNAASASRSAAWFPAVGKGSLEPRCQARKASKEELSDAVATTQAKP
jgi:hypothetical protein